MAAPPISDFQHKMKRLAEPLPIDVIEFRVQSISKTGWAILLAYKDARVDMDRLDEVFGAGFWQRKHEGINGHMFCSVGVWNTDIGQWAWVQDAGVESNTEKTKGEASDSFKRACFNLGIGRELYSFPFLMVQLQPNEFIPAEGKDKPKATYELELKNWVWMLERTDPDENGKTAVRRLSAVDQHGKPRLQWPRGAQPASSAGGSTGNGQESQQRSPAAAKTGKSAIGKYTGTDDKPWYNDFEDEEAGMVAAIRKGETTPALILATLEEEYKINTKTRAAIAALK